MSAAAAQLLGPVAAIARRAAQEILAVYGSGSFATTLKEDDSPLTRADTRAHALIAAALAELTPQVPVLSEEGGTAAWAQRRLWTRYWLVDPLDGTREFLARNGEFTVNIALIEAHQPVLGVVHVPVQDTSYQGLPGSGAWRERAGGPREALQVSAHSAAVVRVAGSRSHRGTSLESFLQRLGPHTLLSIGSALKFCLVAEGAADVYPRLGPTSEWDTAAAHAVTVGAGGRVLTLEGEPLRYNLRDSLLNPHFIAYGPGDRDWLALLAPL
ncbi:MAG: 3'(2'),5'-bisphosphate nucleotidase CysQ [Gammaproteobacteria bacterium]|nr:3'(2'),5'-bisphosphate nucleotidase CysQ [Gammaproteobacteria bacterium]